MNTSPRDHAYDLYFNAGYNLKEIAEKVSVNSKTLYKWMKKGNWKEIKENAVRMPASIVEDMYSQLIAINYNIRQRPPAERFPTKEESEIQRRLITSVKHIKQQATAGEVMQVMTNFISWLLPLDQDMGITLTQYVDIYVKSQGEGHRSPSDIGYFNRPMREEYNKEEEYFNEDAEDSPAQQEPDQETKSGHGRVESGPNRATSGQHRAAEKPRLPAASQLLMYKRRPAPGKEKYYFARPPLEPLTQHDIIIAHLSKFRKPPPPGS